MTRFYFQHLIQVYTAELDVVLSVSSKTAMLMDYNDLTSQYLGS